MIKNAEKFCGHGKFGVVVDTYFKSLWSLRWWSKCFLVEFYEYLNRTRHVLEFYELPDTRPVRNISYPFHPLTVSFSHFSLEKANSVKEKEIKSLISSVKEKADEVKRWPFIDHNTNWEAVKVKLAPIWNLIPFWSSQASLEHGLHSICSLGSIFNQYWAEFLEKWVLDRHYPGLSAHVK